MYSFCLTVQPVGHIFLIARTAESIFQNTLSAMNGNLLPKSGMLNPFSWIFFELPIPGVRSHVLRPPCCPCFMVCAGVMDHGLHPCVDQGLKLEVTV